mmetsp:Transcript_32673/g.102323  ORF Transcript_32673/g.102323 Transcript_32673/m.102323 type:complete len:360 (+) Transcript_32673:140-1219(+)
MSPPELLFLLCLSFSGVAAAAWAPASAVPVLASSATVAGRIREGAAASLAELLAVANSDDLDFSCQGSFAGSTSNESIQALQRCIEALLRYAEEMKEQRKRTLAADSQYAVDVSATSAMLRQLRNQEQAHRRLFDGFRRDEQKEAERTLKSLGSDQGEAPASTGASNSAAQTTLATSREIVAALQPGADSATVAGADSTEAAHTAQSPPPASRLSQQEPLLVENQQRSQQFLPRRLLRHLREFQQPQQQAEQQPQQQQQQQHHQERQELPQVQQAQQLMLDQQPQPAPETQVQSRAQPQAPQLSFAEDADQNAQAEPAAIAPPADDALSDEEVPVDLGPNEDKGMQTGGGGFAVVDEVR